MMEYAVIRYNAISVRPDLDSRTLSGSHRFSANKITQGKQ
jgi:hypothetical protein